MKKLLLIVSFLVLMAMVLAACAPADENENPATTGIPASDEEALASAEVPAMESTLEPGTSPVTSEPGYGAPTEPPAKPEATAALATPNPESYNTVVPATPVSGQAGTPQVRGAEVIPSTGRANVTQLSALLNYTVLDSNAQTIGTVSDLILNMCEAHIIYLVVDADPGLNLSSGSRILVPYEVASLGQGVIDVDQKSIKINVDSSGLSSAPAFSDSLDLSGTDWERDVRAFWSEQSTLSDLSTSCRVPAPAISGSQGTPTGAESGYPSPTGQATGSPSPESVMVTKIAYASDILGMQVQDGNGQPVGQVEEVIVEPESGWLRFLIVSLDQASQTGQSIVAIPVRAVNLDQADGSAEIYLVLTVDRGVLDNAPGLEAVPLPDDNGWETPAMEYWGQHVPLVEGQP